MKNGIYEIGETVWLSGDECECIGEPELFHNAEFQKLRRKDDGKELTTVTPRYKAERDAKKRAEYKAQNSIVTPQVGWK